MLDWTANQTPIHTGFSDKYYAEEGGLAEARYVYIGQNQLEERFQRQGPFVVSELGFGTGLNFLATVKLWRSSPKPSHSSLHYVSTELYPLSSQAIRQALSPWPELHQEMEDFLKVYSPRIHNLALDQDFEREPGPGVHRMNLGGGVFLTLLIGDAPQMLKRVQFQADAWYLDGFSPRKNPQMWSLDILQDVARLSKPGATFATFTVAGHVRRNLQEVGFTVQKFDGFGRKKQMLKGQLKSQSLQNPAPPSQRAIIVGAGLAGTSTAYELVTRGWKVHLVDRHSQIAQESSGNPWGMYYPLLTKHPSKLSEFSLQAYDYLLRRLHAEGRSAHTKTFGILQLKRKDKDFDRYTSALEWIQPAHALMFQVNAAEASGLSGINLREDGIYFPQAGSLKPAGFCQSQIHEQSEISVCTQTSVSGENLSWSSATKTWQLKTSTQTIEAEHLIFCNAAEAQKFSWLKNLSLGQNRGQLCMLNANASTLKLRTILAGDFYLTPAVDDQHLLGATYDRENLSLDVRSIENVELLARTCQTSPDLNWDVDSVVSSRVSLRTSTISKLPLVGEIGHGPGPVSINLGHGSRGIVYAPLAAQILADTLSQMPVAATAEMVELLRPRL